MKKNVPSNVSKKKKSKFKIIFFVVSLLFVSVIYGKHTSADKDVESMLTNWFQKQQAESFQGMASVLNGEKERLLQDLSLELKNDMGQTKKELNQYSQEEVQKRVAELRNYTEQLKRNIQNGSGNENTETFAQLDAIMEKAIQDLLLIANASPKNLPVQSAPPGEVVEPVEPIIEEVITEPIIPPSTEVEETPTVPDETNIE